MSRQAPAAARLVGFAVALAAAFGLAYGAGTLLADRDGVEVDVAGEPGEHPTSEHPTTGPGH